MTNQRSAGIAAAPLLAVISAMNLSWGDFDAENGGKVPTIVCAQAHLAVISVRVGLGSLCGI
jgi:hypothetical protein